MAPELLINKRLSKAADVYAFGILVRRARPDLCVSVCVQGVCIDCVDRLSVRFVCTVCVVANNTRRQNERLLANKT